MFGWHEPTGVCLSFVESSKLVQNTLVETIDGNFRYQRLHLS